jgi:prophage tail gpP-like protein
MAFKPQEVAEVTLKGMRFRDWESVQVKLAEGESNHTFRLTVSEGRPLASKFADIQIKPGDHCTITLAGELAITGYVETRQVAYTAEQHGIEIIGVSFTKGAVDSAAKTETMEFRKKSFQDIATETLKPTGVKFVPKTPLDQRPFERASIAPGQSIWDFLEPLARQRGITLGTDTAGNMTGRMQWMGGGTMLVEGINILEGREVMTIKGGGGPNESVSQHGGTGVSFDPPAAVKAAHGAKSSSTSNVSSGGQGVYGPNRQPTEVPGHKEDTESRSKMESQQRGAEQL